MKIVAIYDPVTWIVGVHGPIETVELLGGAPM
jgi:hypothetical protein